MYKHLSINNNSMGQISGHSILQLQILRISLKLTKTRYIKWLIFIVLSYSRRKGISSLAQHQTQYAIILRFQASCIQWYNNGVAIMGETNYCSRGESLCLILSNFSKDHEWVAHKPQGKNQGCSFAMCSYCQHILLSTYKHIFVLILTLVKEALYTVGSS